MPANSLLRPSLLRDVTLLLLVCYAAFFFNLGKIGLIDPDEPFYALTAREMVASGDWLTPQIFGAPQFEKPIFYYWMAAGSFALFGESEFTGRFPTAVTATLLVLLTYAFGRRAFNRRTGLIAGLYMATGVELLVMGRLMLTDIPLTLFVTGSLFCYWLALREPERRDRWIFLHMVCTGLAVLTKGPIGSIVPLLATASFSYITGKRFLLRGKGFWWGLAAYAAIVVPWYTLMVVKYQWKFVDEFFIRDNWLRFLKAEHPANNHLWYYPGVLILGSLPWLPGIVLAIREFFQRSRPRTEAQIFVSCWFFGNLLFLSAAASKLPSYGFFLFVPLALAVGTGLDSLFSEGFRTRAEKRIVIGAAVLQTAVVIAAPFVKIAKPFSLPVSIFAVFLAVALLFFLLRRYRLWVAATALSAVAFVATALTFSADKVESISSVRPIALKMLELQKEGEPLLAGKFAIRGIHFYTRQPVAVIANNEHPFWADHPLEIIPSKKELDRYLEKYPTALCTMRHPEWSKYHNAEPFAASNPHEWFGENLFIRAVGKPKSAKKKRTPKHPEKHAEAVSLAPAPQK